MIIILIVVLLIAWLVYLGITRDRDFFGGAAFTTASALVVFTIIWTTSYFSYLNTRSFYGATREQYVSALNVYEKRAVLDVHLITEQAFSDFKYEGLQKEMADFTRDLRNRVINYNSIIIKKRVMKRNPFVNWLIVAPDEDMKVISLREEVRRK